MMIGAEAFCDERRCLIDPLFSCSLCKQAYDFELENARRFTMEKAVSRANTKEVRAKGRVSVEDKAALREARKRAKAEEEQAKAKRMEAREAHRAECQRLKAELARAVAQRKEERRKAKEEKEAALQAKRAAKAAAREARDNAVTEKKKRFDKLVRWCKRNDIAGISHKFRVETEEAEYKRSLAIIRKHAEKRANEILNKKVAKNDYGKDIYYVIGGNYA